jgi:hypothetical protein
MNWLSKRKLRYKNQRIVPFEEIRERARTGDIILFHKTTRKGLMETLEVDVLSPLVFDQTEFRHCGIVVRKNGELHVMECADEFHSGHTDATYLTQGTGIRLVPIDALLTAYNRDNGDPHFGIKHISEEIPPEKIDAFVREYRSVNYLKFHKIATVLLSHVLLPRKIYNRIVKRFDNEMMCSEFVHNFLNRSGVLGDYPSKLFMPYYIENDTKFRQLEIVKYSDIVRFRYSSPSAQGAA